MYVHTVRYHCMSLIWVVLSIRVPFGVLLIRMVFRIITIIVLFCTHTSLSMCMSLYIYISGGIASCWYSHLYYSSSCYCHSYSESRFGHMAGQLRPIAAGEHCTPHRRLGAEQLALGGLSMIRTSAVSPTSPLISLPRGCLRALWTAEAVAILR